MSQNTKNYSNLLDTEMSLAVGIDLSVVTDNGCPWVRVQVNDTVLWDEPMVENKQFKIRVPVLAPLTFEIAMSEKRYSAERETATVIDRITVDGLDIIPEFNHHAVYKNDHQYTEPTSYLGFNGVWKLETRAPFYLWWHRVAGLGWLLEPRR